MAFDNLFGIDVSLHSDAKTHPAPQKQVVKAEKAKTVDDLTVEQVLSSKKELQPEGGDRKNYMMFYTGPGYEGRSRADVESYAAAHGMKYIYWATDESTRYTGLYNGDTLMTYRDVSALPKNYQADATKFGRLIPEVERLLQAERYANLSEEEASRMSDQELSDAALAYQDAKDDMGD